MNAKIDIPMNKPLNPVNGMRNPNRNGPTPIPKSYIVKNVDVANPIRFDGASFMEIA